MFTTELPAEIVIVVLSYLPLSSLSSLLAVNKEWQYFIDGNLQNRNTIYRNAACLEGFVDHPTIMLETLGPKEDGSGIFSERTTRGVETWKDFCRKRRMNMKAWAGRAPSTIMPSTDVGIDGRPPHHLRVHRIKVDELVGITMATTQSGGLIVRDIETEEVLWQLPTWYVRQFAHLEYGRGYMIFDRDDGNKEVWRRTAGTYEPTELFEPASVLDERQQNVVNYLASAHADPSILKGRFTPYAMLHMPEPTRAYRFVYPTLLVASLERAYLWDVRTGAIIQIIENIQVIRAPDSATEWLDQQQQETGDDEQGLPPELSEVTDTLLGTLGSHQSAAQGDDEREESDDEEDDDENHLPQFLGLVRYVDLSERHVFFAGRYLLRIFSRETGKCIMDIPSIRLRYGRWRWEVASKKYTGDTCDTLTKAKEQGREAVRVPLKFYYEEHSRNNTMVVDQFIAAHVTSDGKHLAALLSGARLFVIHHFEELLDKHPLPDFSLLRLPTLSGSTSVVAARTSSSISSSSSSTMEATAGPSSSSSTPSQNNLRRYRLTLAQRRRIARVIREAHKRVQEKKERELFDNTMDIQLGPPAVSSSVYLAYENGRIGVVTTNAVYVVIPEVPTLKCPTIVSKPTSSDARVENLQAPVVSSDDNSSTLRNSTVDAPCVRVTRFPFFSNPSWLSEVSCLMMSDSGLFLNWNPEWPRREIEPTYYDEQMKENYITFWEQEYEEALQKYEENENERYLRFSNGDMYIAPSARANEDSEISTIYSVNFLPSSTAASTSPTPSD